MKKAYNYIILSVLAFAAVGCLEDEFNPDGPLGNSGDEVQFGLSLNDPSTKTIYGAETETGFPLYWSEGDKIQIASPQCVDGRNHAEYLVTPQAGQSYALAMTRTGDYGVQWGSSTASADFYSIYPSNGTSWTTLESGNVVAKLNISSEQSANLVLTPAETEETTDGTEIKTPGWYQAADMNNVIMYAPKTTAAKGDVVKLNYVPYSTILEFELGIKQNTDTEGNLVTGENAWGTVKIVSMTLTAPEGTAIAGDFSLKFNGSDVPSIEAAGNNSNSIKMVFTTQPLLSQENQTLKAKIAMIPISGVTTLDGWKVTMEVLEGTDATTKTYSKTFTGSGNKTALAPGKVHKLKLPKFSQIEAWNPPTDAWIPSLEDYKNIYLTELSVPGAWYAGAPTDDGYQATADIPTLWNAGVRAFAVECRTSSEWVWGLFSGSFEPASVVISGTQDNGTLGIGDYCRNGTKIRTTIKSIADQVANSLVRENAVVVDGEYAVLILSYADGGEAGHRDVDYAYFINGIKTEIAESGATNIYNGEVNANTTINDVLGKLIIKVNVDDYLTKSDYSYANNAGMNALISYNPFLQQLPEGTDFETPLFSKMYWSAWEDSYKVTTTNNTTDFLWCFASANRTQLNSGTNTTIPTYAQRQEALRGMMTHSKDLTASQMHNVWFYFNAGGTQATAQSGGTTSATDFAAEMNKWLYDLVRLKANGGTDTNGVYGTKGAYIESDPSPLGIVMFNQCTGANATYHGADIINEIIQMNNKFKLLRKNGANVSSAAASYSSGMHDQDVAAFGWD